MASAWANFAGYEAVWLCAVIAAANGLAWPTVMAFVVFAAWQIGVSHRRQVQWRLLTLALGCGLVLDGIFSVSGLIDYATPHPALPPGGAPVWILSLWGAFALTLTSSLRYLQKNLWLACALGAMGGPLAFWSAAQAWSVVRFAAPQWHALLALAVGWAMAMPLLAGMARRWEAQVPAAQLRRRYP